MSVKDKIEKEFHDPETDDNTKKLIEKYFKDNVKDVSLRKLRILEALHREKIKWQKIGTGLHDGVFYFGTNIEENNAIVTSDKKIFIDNKEKKEIKDEFGLNYRFPLFADCIDYSWSNKSIEEWLFGEPNNISIAGMYKEIKNINCRFIYHVDSRVHSYIALYILATYFYPIFESIGRLFFLADKNSGKTKQSQIFQLLTFNSIFSSDISPSTFYRLIESTGATIIIDDFDSVDDDRKKMIVQHIRTGYKEGGKALRSEGKGFRPTKFNNYAPVILNNTLGLDGITESRCEKILMLRTTENITKRKLNMRAPHWQELRDKLHICALQNWKDVAVKYEKIEVEELSDRDLEKNLPILTLAKIVGDDVYREILSFLVQQIKQADIRNMVEDWEFIMWKGIKELLGKEREMWIYVSSITERIHSDCGIDYDSKDHKKRMRGLTTWIGKQLAKNPLFKGGLTSGKSRYQITASGLDRFLKLKGYDKQISPPSSTTPPTLLTLPTSPTPPLTTHKETGGQGGESEQHNNNAKKDRLTFDDFFAVLVGASDNGKGELNGKDIFKLFPECSKNQKFNTLVAEYIRRGEKNGRLFYTNKQKSRIKLIIP